jgi:hypothetical protein
MAAIPFKVIKHWLLNNATEQETQLIDADLAKGSASQVAATLDKLRQDTAKIVGPASWKPAEPGADTLEDVYLWLVRNKEDSMDSSTAAQDDREQTATVESAREYPPQPSERPWRLSHDANMPLNGVRFILPYAVAAFFAASIMVCSLYIYNAKPTTSVAVDYDTVMILRSLEMSDNLVQLRKQQADPILWQEIDFSGEQSEPLKVTGNALSPVNPYTVMFDLRRLKSYKGSPRIKISIGPAPWMPALFSGESLVESTHDKEVVMTFTDGVYSIRGTFACEKVGPEESTFDIRARLNISMPQPGARK